MKSILVVKNATKIFFNEKPDLQTIWTTVLFSTTRYLIRKNVNFFNNRIMSYTTLICLGYNLCLKQLQKHLSLLVGFNSVCRMTKNVFIYFWNSQLKINTMLHLRIEPRFYSRTFKSIKTTKLQNIYTI